jgi:hypothetical protein
MGADSPFWTPGGREAAVAGSFDDLPPGTIPLLRRSAELFTRAFTAFAAGDWEGCDARLAEGLELSEEVFTVFVERVTSPLWLSRVDSPHWVPFVAHAVFMVLASPPAPAQRPTPAPPAKPVNLADEMRAMGWM